MGNIKRRRKTKRLSLLEDYDQDGVPNFDDCRPLDPTQQHVLTPVVKVGEWVGQKAYELGHSTGRRLSGQAPLPHYPGGVYQDTTPAAEYSKRYMGGPPRRGTYRGAAPKTDPSITVARQRSTARQHAEFKKAEKWNIASIQGRVYFDIYGIKRIAATKALVKSLGGRISPLSAAGISVAQRAATTITDVGADIGHGITTKLGQLGTDMQRQAPKEERPLQETILFGGFIGKGERVGRLAVAPTPQQLDLKRIEATPVREPKRVRFAPTIPFVSDVPSKLVAMYRGIKPPPEVQAHERRVGALETGVAAFETKWQPYVKEERFVGTEQQYKQMLKEQSALETQLPDIERMQQEMSGLQYAKAERKLAGYKTGWIYTGTEKFLETTYPPYIRKAQEAVSGWQREIGYKPSEHPWLKEIEHAQWYTAKELPGMVLRMGAMLPPAVEAAVFKPKERAKMQAAVVPGLAFMGKGMIEEAQREPLGFAETMGISMLALKAAVRISPVKPMYMKVPTGKSIVKTWTTIGKGMPSEFKALKEVAGPFSAVELGKIEATWAPGIYKQTHLIPEMATYRGLRLDLPSIIPYRGKTPLMGVVTKPPGVDVTRIKFKMGTPEFELPTQFRVFTGPEARLVMPSMRKMLKGEELAAWEAAMYLQETFGRKRPIVREPLKISELEHLQKAFGGTEGLQDFTRYMQRYHRQILVYGSGAKRVQMARAELITPKDIDIEIRSIAAHLSGLTTEMKAPFRARLTPFEVEMAHRVSRRLPGLTPEKAAADIAAISKKYLGAEEIQVTFKPAWQMFSVEKTLKTMEKTQFGLQPEVMTLADIHPPSGLFEFGLKPQRAIKVPVISGLLGEKRPLFPKRVRMTTLGEEFERSFASVMQMYERRGTIFLGPKPKRVKDIGRFVQTGKMLVETERLRAELGLGILRGRRMRKVGVGREALEIWEKRALKVPELKEVAPAIKAEAILPGMETILKRQMQATSFLLSERAALGPAYKISVRDVDYPKPQIGKLIDTSAYYPKTPKYVPSDYYPKMTLPIDSAYYPQKMPTVGEYYPKPTPAYGDYDHYGAPMYKHVTKHAAPIPFIGAFPTFVPFSVPKIVGVGKPTLKVGAPPPPTTHFVPPPTFIPFVPPLTGWTPPPPPTTVWTPPPPPPPPPTTVWTPPPPPPTYVFPILPSKEKPRRRKKKFEFEEAPWKEKHYIPTLQELMRHAPGMETTKLTTLEPKMPKLPKGIM